MRTRSFAVAVVCGSVVFASSLFSSVAHAASADREKLKKWNQTNIVEAYEKVGRRDAKWDAAAREMLAATARLRSSDRTPTGDEEDVILLHSKTTRKFKCDDPLILYITARSMEYWHREPEVVAKYVTQCADAMPASGYHPFYKCRALLRAAEYKVRSKTNVEQSIREARSILEKAIEQMAAVVADVEVPRAVLFGLMEEIGDASKEITENREQFAGKAFEILDAKCKDRSLVLSVTGQFYSSYAWDARGLGYADNVNDENFKVMAERLEPAAVAGEEAWKIDNNNVFASVIMLKVELGQGEGRERMETWFKRAMAADADSYNACERKLLYLAPKWHGSIDEMLAFGRECLSGENWDAGLPLILVDAHLDAAHYTEGGYQPKVSPTYFATNPNAFADVKKVYDLYLARVPQSLYHRSRYAQIAAWAGQWADADKQFKAMGDRFSYGYFRNESVYRSLRAEVLNHLQSPSP